MRLWLSIAAASGFLAVAVGALAAHGPLDHLSPQARRWIETGADYQMIHALALLAVSWLAERPARPGRWAALAGGCFVTGTILFSGTLYLMALTGAGAVGALVPVGGAAFLLGWAALLVYGWRAGGRSGGA